MKFQQYISPLKGHFSLRFNLEWLYCFFFIWMLISSASAQEPAKKAETDKLEEQSSVVADQVQVNPVLADEAISKRLTGILEATGWFSDLEIKVEEGVVFLNGRADSVDHQV